MGCSSSALPKAGGSRRLRSEVNVSRVAQPKSHTLGRESTFYGKTQKENLPLSEKFKISMVSTANGVNSVCEHPLTKDTITQPRSTGNTQPSEGSRECVPSQPGDKDATREIEEKKDEEVVTETQCFEGDSENETSGAEAECQLLRTTEQSESPGTVEGTENVQSAGETISPRTTEKIPSLKAARELQAQHEVGQDEQSQLPETVSKENESPELLKQNQLVEETEEQRLGKNEQSQLLKIPKENESPEVLEGSQLVEGAEEQQLQETLGKDVQSPLLETIPKENRAPKILEGNQFIESAVKNGLHDKTTTKVPENMEEVEIEGSMEHPAGISETGTTGDMVRKIHINEEDQHVEVTFPGETREKVETEMENEKVIEGTETKEEETGEAVDLSATT